MPNRLLVCRRVFFFFACLVVGLSLASIGAIATAQRFHDDGGQDKSVKRKQALNEAEVHVRGLYESHGGKAIVEVRKSKKPIILVLCAYESVTWNIHVDEGAQVVQVIASGYHKQTVEGVKVPVATYSADERSVGRDDKPLYFYTYDHNEENYPNMEAKVRELTGKRVSTFQGRYSFKKMPFQVGDEK